MILLFTSTILREDCHFVEESCNFERRRIYNDHSQRSIQEENRETETDSMN
jgi:hypothetical protein